MEKSLILPHKKTFAEWHLKYKLWQTNCSTTFTCHNICCLPIQRRSWKGLTWIRKCYLWRHDQFVVDDVVRCVAHAEQGAGGVQVAGHACTAVDILPQTLQQNMLVSSTSKTTTASNKSCHHADFWLTQVREFLRVFYIGRPFEFNTSSFEDKLCRHEKQVFVRMQLVTSRYLSQQADWLIYVPTVELLQTDQVMLKCLWTWPERDKMVTDAYEGYG